MRTHLLWMTCTRPQKPSVTKNGVPKSVSSMPAAAQKNSMGDTSAVPDRWSISACSEILNTARTAMAGMQGLRCGVSWRGRMPCTFAQRTARR